MVAMRTLLYRVREVEHPGKPIEHWSPSQFNQLFGDIILNVHD